MPRQPRLDVPGLTHHVMARGIENVEIFLDPRDYQAFSTRLEEVICGAGARLFAWCLMPNHFHLLLRPDNETLAWIMRRLMTSHAVRFNLRHDRKGHLFQGRYKSLAVEDEPYFLELVRYIHLNPLRANLVDDVRRLGDFSYSGHGTLIGRTSFAGQDVEEVLRRFSPDRSRAIRHYQYFIAAGADRGQVDELSMEGGRALGGGERGNPESNGDSRILGSHEFVKSIHRSLAPHPIVRSERRPVGAVLEEVAGQWQLSREQILGPSRERKVTMVRREFLLRAYEESGQSMAALGRMCGRSHTAVRQALEKAREERKTR